jgi:hypothetical protein
MLALSRLLLFLIIIACAYVNCHITLALDCATPYKNFMGVEFIWVGGGSKKIGGQGVDP